MEQADLHVELIRQSGRIAEIERGLGAADARLARQAAEVEFLNWHVFGR